MEALAKFSFKATSDDELSFIKGATIKILDLLDVSEASWCKAELEGHEGMVPANYITMQPHEWFRGKIKRADAEELLLNDPQQPDGGFLVRVSESCNGDYSLSVKFMSKVQHFKILRDGAGKYFLWVVKFPSINKMIEYHRTSSVSRTETIFLRDSIVKETEKLKALYDFDPEEEGEVLFKKGDILEVLDKTDPDWYKGKNLSSGQVGVFPVSYCSVLD